MKPFIKSQTSVLWTLLGVTMVDEIEVPIVQNPVVFVDVQGFRAYKKRFIVKEFYLSDDDGIYHNIVKSPYSFNRLNDYYQRHANWVTRFCHGLQFDCGDITVDELIKTIYPRIKDKCILVKGVEKINWLKYIFRECGEIQGCSIEEVGHISKELDDKTYDICDYHNRLFGWNSCRCPLANVLKLQEYEFYQL